jgi:hypothetical protein
MRLQQIQFHQSCEVLIISDTITTGLRDRSYNSAGYALLDALPLLYLLMSPLLMLIELLF